MDRLRCSLYKCISVCCQKGYSIIMLTVALTAFAAIFKTVTSRELIQIRSTLFVMHFLPLGQKNQVPFAKCCLLNNQNHLEKGTLTSLCHLLSPTFICFGNPAKLQAEKKEETTTIIHTHKKPTVKTEPCI